jgi:hypothetical protein
MQSFGSAQEEQKNQGRKDYSPFLPVAMFSFCTTVASAFYRYAFNVFG